MGGVTQYANMTSFVMLQALSNEVLLTGKIKSKAFAVTKDLDIWSKVKLG